MNSSKEKSKKKKLSLGDGAGAGADSAEEDGEISDSSDGGSEAALEDVEFSGGFRVPRALYNRLFPYQRTAVKWMWELHCQEAGGIIGDEMGLGKTVQTVAFLAGLHHSGLLEAPVLLLCPATIMAQWVRHFHEWYPPLRVVVVHDSGSHARAASGSGRKTSAEKLVREAFRRGGVVVTTYDHLRIRADLMASQVPTRARAPRLLPAALARARGSRSLAPVPQGGRGSRPRPAMPHPIPAAMSRAVCNRQRGAHAPPVPHS